MNHCIKNDFAIFSHTSTPFGYRYNEINFETFNFSGGEVHIKIDPPEFPMNNIRINCRIKKSDDLMLLALAIDALRKMGTKYIEAFIPYIPYARQDRRMITGEPLSIKVFSNIINSLKLDKVICYDTHSDVSTGLIDNIQCYNNIDEVYAFVNDLPSKYDNLIAISPDAGAYKKIYKMCKALNGAYGANMEIVTANKVRDLNTGNILSTDVYGNVEGRNCLIVDDICDGGRTFTELGKALKDKGANDLYLFVSHGIFSKGYAQLFKYYRIIGTTNSFNEEYASDIKTIKLVC